MMNAIYSTKDLVEKATRGKSFKVADWTAKRLHNTRNSHVRTEAAWRAKKNLLFRSAFGDKKLGKVYNRLNKEKLLFTMKDGTEVKLSQFEAGYWYGLMKDPTNIPIFQKNMGWTPDMFKKFDEFVDPKMKQYVDSLMEDWFRRTIRPAVAERYGQKFKTALPDNPNYMVRTYTDTTPVDDVTNLLLGDNLPGFASTTPNSVKVRIGSNSGFRKESIEVIARRHSEQMNQFIHYDSLISDFRSVFNDPVVKSTILKSRGGKELHSTLMKKIDDVARGNMAAAASISSLDSAISRFTQATLTANFVPFAKQLTSTPGFTMGRNGVKYSELIQGSMLYFKNPVKWTRMFAQDDWLFGRLSTGFNRETALAFKSGNKNYTIKDMDMTIERFLQQSAVTPTRMGDVIALLPGLTAKYTQVTKQLRRTTNLTKKQIHQRAIREATELAEQSQQSPWIENLGRIQTANSVGKAITMYQTTPIQYLRISTSTARMWGRGQITPRKAARTIFTSWVLLPQLFQFASNGFNWNSERQMRALMIGPINYYPAVGNLAVTFFDAFQNGFNWRDTSSAISPMLSIFEKGVDVGIESGKLFRGEEDMWGTIEELYVLAAMNAGFLPTTAPRTLEGIMDLVEGDTKDPRRLFWSEWALDKGEEDIINRGIPGRSPGTRTAPGR